MSSESMGPRQPHDNAGLTLEVQLEVIVVNVTLSERLTHC